MAAKSSDDVRLIRPPFERELPPSGHRLRASSGSDPETVWVGHVASPTGLPGTPRGYGPYHVGRGPNRIVGGLSGSPSGYNGVWDFDHFQTGETDSLMGWWPVTGHYGFVGQSNLDDWKRPWFGLDYGNKGNYVIPQGSPKRTFGVVGYWHADGGSTMPAVPADPASHNPLTPTWAPIAGAKSAWCGLRSHGDVAVVDPATGNPFNSQVLDYPGNSDPQFGSASPTGTDRNLPGYGSQWDQMLYRDLQLPQSSGLTLSFDYATNMSTQFRLDHWSQTGWFDKDPLKPVISLGDGNFMSTCNECGAPGVVDSLMVYIGAPVEPVPNAPPLFAANDFLATDGAMYDIYDRQRRWFSEVLKINAPGLTYREVLSVAGVNGTTAAPAHFSQSFNQAVINPILDADGVAGDGGKVRLVFRVKTNRGFDDENYGNSFFSSGTAGAAILDDVAVNGATIGDFESAGSGIDNDPTVPATAAWKSTGKPPGAYFHAHSLGNGLPYYDPCGPITALVRFCNMGSTVLSPGDHDLADKPGGIFGSNSQERLKYAVSPTINLCSSAPGDYNGMGIDAEIAARGPLLWGDVMWNLYQLFSTGGTFAFGWQSYPAAQANGVKCWGAMRTPFTFGTDRSGCFGGLWSDALAEGSIVTSNPSGVPDSIRVYLQSHTRCYLFSLTSSNCSPASGPTAGGYFDNLSIGFVPKRPPAFAQSLASLQFNDCFPVNSQNKSVTFFGPAYDTLAARIQGVLNETDFTKNDLTGPDARENIAGDSAGVKADGDNVRVDLVFRILPGVGNYVQIGNRASGAARRPDTVPRVSASPSDPANGGLTVVDRFWGAYMADNGAFGTDGNGTSGPGHPGGVWDPNRWNSARMDTVETNFFPMQNIDPNLSGLSNSGFYMTCYHESDPKYAVLGIAKNRCFLNKNKQPVKINQDQTNCGDVARFGAYPPAFYTGNPASGYNPNEIPGQPGKTYEFTKILPDGQFTPGTEIQYFARKSKIGEPVTAFDMLPDTNFISHLQFDSFDTSLRRWYEVSVLPDRWKDPGFGGTGMACMLVVELGDFDEPTWVALTDSIGLTTPAKRGAHNGWRARPDQDITGNVGGDDSICRRDNGGQAGSMWDLYTATLGNPSGGLGSRAAAKNTTTGSLTVGRWCTHGPSEDMLKNYRVVTLLAPAFGNIGPLPNHTDDDIGLLNAFLNVPGGSPQPRAMMAMGSGFAVTMSDPDRGHPSFLTGVFLASLRSADYRIFSGNTNDVADLVVQPPVAPAPGFTYGVFNRCTQNLSVFDTPAPGGQVATYYENVGAFGPYVASIYGPENATSRPYRTLIDGWSLGTPGFGAKCPGCVGLGGQPILLSVGVRKYMFDLLTDAFGGLLCAPPGPPVGVGDQPGSGPGSAFVNFLELESSNPMRAREARIVFGLGESEKVKVEVYDVTGRRVRTVANRVFASGQEHVVTWDGRDDAGERLRRGVYFYRLTTPTWTSQKKLVMLGAP